MCTFATLVCRCCGQISTRCLSSTTKSQSHYAALGITSQATQADVKAAYYKLTKLYHPDRSQGFDAEENTNKFRQVAAAYEVLGNVKLRRLYDKGMHHIGSAPRRDGPAWAASQEEDDPALKFYRSREVRSRPPAPSGTPIYDFDAWSRQHYGATFMRDQTIKKRREARSAFYSDKQDDVKIERVLIATGVLLAAFLILTHDLRRSHDDVVVVYKRPETSKDKAEN